MHYRSSLFALALVAVASSSAQAQRPMSAQPSGRATTEIVLTLVDSAARAAAQPSIVRIDYGQPHLRGRALHTETLVPYDKVWRLGANNATTLKTDVDLVMGGAEIPKGSYVLQAIPSRAGWKLLVQRDTASPMAAAMATRPAGDVAQIDLRVSTLPAPLESLTMWLIPSTAAGNARGELRLAWGTTMLTTDWSVK